MPSLVKTNTSATSLIAPRIAALARIRSRVEPVPEKWLQPKAGGNGKALAGTSGDLSPIACHRYSDVMQAWKKSGMKMTDGLDYGLSVMLASVASTSFVGEQLWVKIISPPSTGKTSLLEGIATASRWTVSKDTIKGFVSGYKGEDEEDSSLINLVNNKTLLTKDGDTLLKQPNLAQILSEARSSYDRNIRTHYRNAKMNDYIGHRFTWSLCGTSALRELDDSELGQRFLDCVLMDDIDDDFEDEVAWRAANQEARNMTMEANGAESSQYPPELAEAMQLTGGYVNYLRENAAQLSSGITISDDVLRQLGWMGKFVAYMRARPPKSKSDEKADREFSPRLVKQLVRMARSMAIVLNRHTVDEECMRRTLQVAMDTARGVTFNMLKILGTKPPQGVELKALELYTGMENARIKVFVRFLRHIQVLDRTTGNQILWHLTPKIVKLHQHIASLREMYGEIKR